MPSCIDPMVLANVLLCHTIAEAMRPKGPAGLKCVSLCSGIGILDLALYMAGIDILTQCDNNLECLEVLRQIPAFTKVPKSDDIKHADMREGLANMVAIGLPCTDVSASGNREGPLGEHTGIWQDLCVLLKKSTWINYGLLECTPTLMDTLHGDTSGAQYIMDSLHACGFHYIVSRELEAAASGIPMVRERFFVTFSRTPDILPVLLDPEIMLPCPGCDAWNEGKGRRRCWDCWRKAMDNDPVAADKEAVCYDPGNTRSMCSWGFMRTLLTGNQVVILWKGRAMKVSLLLKELLMGIPWDTPGSASAGPVKNVTERTHQVGNAVSYPLVWVIAMRLVAMIEKKLVNTWTTPGPDSPLEVAPMHQCLQVGKTHEEAAEAKRRKKSASDQAPHVDQGPHVDQASDKPAAKPWSKCVYQAGKNATRMAVQGASKSVFGYLPFLTITEFITRMCEVHNLQPGEDPELTWGVKLGTKAKREAVLKYLLRIVGNGYKQCLRVAMAVERSGHELSPGMSWLSSTKFPVYTVVWAPFALGTEVDMRLKDLLWPCVVVHRVTTCKRKVKVYAQHQNGHVLVMYMCPVTCPEGVDKKLAWLSPSTLMHYKAEEKATRYDAIVAELGAQPFNDQDTAIKQALDDAIQRAALIQAASQDCPGLALVKPDKKARCTTCEKCDNTQERGQNVCHHAQAAAMFANGHKSAGLSLKGHSLVGAVVAVWWESYQKYYRGKVMTYCPSTMQHYIKFEQDEHSVNNAVSEGNWRLYEEDAEIIDPPPVHKRDSAEARKTNKLYVTLGKGILGLVGQGLLGARNPSQD